jgi:hypothetical protein
VCTCCLAILSPHLLYCFWLTEEDGLLEKWYGNQARFPCFYFSTMSTPPQKIISQILISNKDMADEFLILQFENFSKLLGLQQLPIRYILNIPCGNICYKHGGFFQYFNESLNFLLFLELLPLYRNGFNVIVRFGLDKFYGWHWNGLVLIGLGHGFLH